MPKVDFTLEDVRKIVKEEVRAEVGAQIGGLRSELKADLKSEVGGLRAEFQSFINDNFNPAMEHIDERFDTMEDRVDRLAGDMAELRVDVRHLKQVVRGRA